jgi:hypothetical protein
MISILVSATLGFAPESFRSQSTSGIWEDGYDVVLDPARTLELGGWRLYSNLSNYVTGNEAQFGFNSSNFFLIGGSGNIRGRLGPAAVFDYRSFKLPQFTGLLDPYTGDSLTGTARLDSVEWRDLDTNGTYDFKHVSRTERNAWSCGTGHDLYVGCGVAWRRHVFGAALAWDDSLSSESEPEWDYVRHRYDSSLVAGRLTYLEDDTSRQSDHRWYDRKRLVLSARLALPRALTLGLNFQPALVSHGYDWTQSEWAQTDRNPGGAGVEDYDRLTLSDSLVYPVQGVMLPLTVELATRREGSSSGEGLKSGAAETRLYVTGFYRAEGADSSAGEMYVADYFRTLNPGQERERYTTAHKYHGTSQSAGVSVRLLRRHWLGERLDLGWGVAGGLSGIRDSLFDMRAVENRTEVDDGDSLPTRGDYVSTYTRMESWQNRSTGLHASVALPIGLEFRPIRQVGLRLGARPSLVFDDVATASELLAVAAPKTRVDYGDGTYSEFAGDIQLNPNSVTSQCRVTPSTTFTYGLGIQPLDNLQLDLMGFANLTNLTNWRLSVSFRF